jgi:hypothetical protein
MMMANNERERDEIRGSACLTCKCTQRICQLGANSSKTNGRLRGTIMVGNEQEPPTMSKRCWPACCGAAAADISWSSRIRGTWQRPVI